MTGLAGLIRKMSGTGLQANKSTSTMETGWYRRMPMSDGSHRVTQIVFPLGHHFLTNGAREQHTAVGSGSVPSTLP